MNKWKRIEWNLLSLRSQYRGQEFWSDRVFLLLRHFIFDPLIRFTSKMAGKNRKSVWATLMRKVAVFSVDMERWINKIEGIGYLSRHYIKGVGEPTEEDLKVLNNPLIVCFRSE